MKNAQSLYGPTHQAAGYAKGVTDFPRQSAYNMIAMVGELFSNNGITSYKNIHFRIGTSRTYTPFPDGYLNCFANDIITGYGDNSGSVTLTIKRTQ